MCSRGVWQLQKLTLRYHWHRGASAGCRGFVQEHIIPFAKDNTQVKIETLATRGHPNVTAEYLNGRSKVLNLANKNPTEVKKAFYALRDSCGHKNRRYKKNVYDSVPSVQGIWDPSTSFRTFTVSL